jgi:hypothetical protein
MENKYAELTNYVVRPFETADPDLPVYRILVKFADSSVEINGKTYDLTPYGGVGEADEYGDAFALGVYNLWREFDQYLFDNAG